MFNLTDIIIDAETNFLIASFENRKSFGLLDSSGRVSRHTEKVLGDCENITDWGVSDIDGSISVSFIVNGTEENRQFVYKNGKYIALHEDA